MTTERSGKKDIGPRDIEYLTNHAAMHSRIQRRGGIAHPLPGAAGRIHRRQQRLMRFPWQSKPERRTAGGGYTDAVVAAIEARASCARSQT